MKITAEQIRNVIYESIDEINSFQAKDRKIEKGEDSILYGQNTKLDSLGLVNLIVEVEQRMTDKLNVTIDLTDEKALSQNNSPFLTVKSLCEYIIIHLNQSSSDN